MNTKGKKKKESQYNIFETRAKEKINYFSFIYSEYNIFSHDL